MGSIVSRLAPKDKKALALFYETDSFSANGRLIKLVKANALRMLGKAVDIGEVKHLQGQIHALERMEATYKEIYKQDQKS